MISLYLLLFIKFFLNEFSYHQSCVSTQTLNMAGQQSLFFVESGSIISITGTSLKLDVLSTFSGVFKEADEINDIKCSTNNSPLNFKFESVFKYVIVSDTTPQKTALIIANSKHQEFITQKTYIYKSIYHKYDFECFHQETIANGKENEIITKMGGTKFSDSAKNLVCFWFGDEKTGSVQLTYNTNQIHIRKVSRYGQSSYVSKSLSNCPESSTNSPNGMDKVVNALTDQQKEFCVQSGLYSLDKIKRTYPTQTNNHHEEYCKYEKSNKFCIKVGDDFEYALFITESSSPTRMIVMSKRTSDKSSFSEEQLKENSNISINEIKCGKKQTYTEKFMKFIGIYDSEKNLHCLISAEFSNVNSAIYEIESAQVTKQYAGCVIVNPTEVKNDWVIKLDSSSNFVCLSHGYTIVKHIQAPNFNFEKHILHEDRVCSLEFTFSICYRIASDVNYVVISNEYTHTSTLIYRTGELVNPTAADEFLYAPKYYKNHIVTVKLEKVSNYNEIKENNYVFVNGDKVLFLISGMTDNDKINIKNTVGCASRQLSVTPGEDAPSQPEISLSDCDSFHKTDRNLKATKVLTEITINTCLQITCTKRLYSFSVKDINENGGIGSIIECVDGGGACVITDSAKLVVYRVETLIQNQRIFVSTPNPVINFDENIMLHETDYYKHDVLCLRTAKIQEGNEAQIFQLEAGDYSCSLIREIEQSEKRIKYKSSNDCEIIIKLHGYSVNPNPNQRSLKSLCDYVITTPIKKFLQVDPQMLSTCLKRTCSKIKSIINTSVRDKNVVYPLTACNSAKDSQKTCLDQAIVGAIIKIKSPRIDQEQVIYTKELTGDIPANHLYDTFYGPGSLVCFMKPRVKDFQSIKVNSVYGDEPKRMCVITNEISNSIKVELVFDRGCKMEIFLSSSVDQAKTTALNTLKTDCNIFTQIPPTESVLIYDDIDKKNTCRTKLCLQPEYMVMNSNSIKICKSESCEISGDVDIKYYKINSLYNNRNIYIIPKDAVKTTIIDSLKSGYYKSIYYSTDIVCYKTDKLRTEDKLPNAAYITLTTKGCYILKELTGPMNIELTIYGTCKRKISLLNTKMSNQPVNPNRNDILCSPFTGENLDTTVIAMSLVNLKTCVRHLCLEPKFIVKSQGPRSDHVATFSECESNSDRCVIDAISFDYVKLQNSYTGETFYVQNIEKRTLTIDEKYFYPGPYYQNEVLCVLTNKITSTSGLTISNSYTLHTYKCVILKEYRNIIKVRIQQDCERDINILNVPGNKILSRIVDSRICKDFISLNSPKSTVYSITFQDFSNCLKETCSIVKSSVDLTNNKPLVHVKPSSCETAEGISTCLTSGILYDFVKVEIKSSTEHRFFRILGDDNLAEYTPTQAVFYSKEYKNDDLVCFNIEKLIGPPGYENLVGVFKEGSRVCVISSELASGIDIDYKIADRYNQRISLTKSTSGSIAINHDHNVKTTCPEFFETDDNADNYHEYDLAALLKCVQDTYSMVVFLVKLDSLEADFVNKKIMMCNKHTVVDSCFNGITYYDAVQIKSPYRNNVLYIRSKAITEKNSNIYKAHFYKNTYHSDDFVCIHDTLIQEPTSREKLPGFLRHQSITCVIVRETLNTQSMKVNLFEKCEKTVHFGRYTIESIVESTDVCSSFYTTQTEGTLIRMSLPNLRTCLISTCSKLIFYTFDSLGQDKFLKNTHTCNPAENGKAECLNGVNNFHLAKVQQGNSEVHIYVEQENADLIDDTLYDTFFYASKYYKDEVVCARTDKIHSNSAALKKVELSNKNQVCFMINDLPSTDKINLILKDGCTKQITIDTVNIRTTDQNSNDDKCKMLYSPSNDQNTIHLMEHTQLKACIQFTCSKIISFVPTTGVDAHYTTIKVSRCSKSYGDVTCLDPTDYDFLKVVNAYVSRPIYFKSKNYDIQRAVENTKQFHSSIYYQDEIVCYTPSLIKNSKELVGLAGVYITAHRTCLMGSEISKEIKLELEVNNKCRRNIFVSNKQSTEFKHASQIRDEKCSSYYKGEDTLVFQSHQEMLQCVVHTCSTYEYINQSISDMNCQDTESECKNRLQSFSYAEITSPFKSPKILVVSEDVKNKWVSQMDKIEKYEMAYRFYEIACFKNDIMTKSSDKPASYTNKDLNIICIHPSSTDLESFISISEEIPMKLKILDKNEKYVQDIISKKVTIIVKGIRSVSGSISEVFKFESKMSDFTSLSDFTELETCAKENEKEQTTEDFTNLQKPNAYAFTIKTNLLLANPLSFLFTERSVCVKKFNSELILPERIDFEHSYKDLHNLQCVVTTKEFLTIKINSKSPEENLHTDQSCLDEEQMKTNCDFVHKYSEHIFICYISRKDKPSDEDSENDEREEEEEADEEGEVKSPVYVMIKKEHCFIPKIMKYKRIAMCKLEETGLTINVLDFEILGKIKGKSNTASKIQQSSWSFLGFVVVACLTVVIFFATRKGKKSPTQVEKI